ncbi:MAG TPA: hypothetical protein VFG14_02120 [Chthoniobacteraceae bacterium]|nr:hypothetical protein [Chthoniobacteraceae bacterium]
MSLSGVFFALAILSLMITDALREIVDRKRLRSRGFGGTGDIHLIGMAFVILFLIISAALYGASWF